MAAHLLNSGIPEICKWCGQVNASIVFENAHLCHRCHEKATWALHNPTVCEVCRVLLTDEDVYKELFSEYGHEHSLAVDLRASAEAGCGFCRMLLLQDPNTDPRRLEGVPLYLQAYRPASTRNNAETAESSVSLGEDINAFYFSTEADLFSLEMSVSAQEGDPAARYISQRPPERNLGNAQTTQKIQGWFRECLEKHPESQSSELPRLPTRVVDVGCESDHESKLFQPVSTVHERYVTLSYCWGTERFITTTLDNIEAHRESLNEASLPKTFQDAIATTRRLGFQYLWIDALCIIQDSSEDKANEIMTMGDIYGGSTLTIAVVSARGVTEGFLEPTPKVSVDLPYRCPDGAMGSVQVFPQKAVDLWEESLYTRAWCLQENLLSSRLLLYTDMEVVWQCQTRPMRRHDTTHVYYVRGDPGFSFSPFRRLPENILHTFENQKDINVKSVDEEHHGLWRYIVENYTNRRLTVASDRLPALAGIVEKLKLAWSDEYSAGHWKRQFIPMLSWRRSSRPQGYFAPLGDYRAPSWSWASIDGPVVFDGRFDLGSTRDLQAKLVSCVFDFGSELKDIAILEASMIRASEIPDPNNTAQGLVYLDDHFEDTWPRFTDQLSKLSDELLERAWCLLLGEGRSGSGKMMKTVALLLVSIVGDDNTFRRIGLYESLVKGRSKTWANSKNRRQVKII